MGLAKPQINSISTISKLILLAVVFIFIFGIFSVKGWDPDFWWHLKTGEYIVQTGTIPTTDPFSYTSLPKDPIHPESKRIKFILTQYWLAQVFFYWVYHLFGFQGIEYMRTFVLTLLLFIVYKAVRKEGLGLYLSIALIVPAVLILHRGFTGERPQLFSFLLSFLLIYLLEGFRKSVSLNDTRTSGDRQSPGILNGSQESPKLKARSGLVYLLPIPFIVLLWANLHGGFILGIVIIFIYLFSETVKYLTKRFGRPLPLSSLKLLIAVGTISALVSLINPNSYNVISVLVELEQSLYKDAIIETSSPIRLLNSGFYNISDPIFFSSAVLLFLYVVLFFVNRRKLDLTDVLILLSLTSMSMSAVRYIPFFAPVATLMIARYGVTAIPKFPMKDRFAGLRRKAEVLLPLVLSAVLVVVLVQGNVFQSRKEKKTYPEGAVRFLKEHKIYGNMFNPYNWGGYLIWALYPDYKVFIDGRGLIEQVFLEYGSIMDASRRNFEGIPIWKAYINTYGVDFILTYSVDPFSGELVPLIPAMLSDPEWHLVYMDNNSLIFLKDDPANGEMIRQFEMPKEWLWNEVITEAVSKSRYLRNSAGFYITIGDAFMAKQSYRDANSAYLKAWRMDPDNPLVAKKLELMRSYGF